MGGEVMKKFALFLLVLVMIFGFSSNVFALGWCDPKCPDDGVYVDRTLVEDFDPDIYINEANPYSDSFDLSNGGMGSEDLLKDADLKIYIWDKDKDYFDWSDWHWKNLEYGELSAEGWNLEPLLAAVK